MNPMRDAFPCSSCSRPAHFYPDVPSQIQDPLRHPHIPSFYALLGQHSVRIMGFRKKSKSKSKPPSTTPANAPSDFFNSATPSSDFAASDTTLIGSLPEPPKIVSTMTAYIRAPDCAVIRTQEIRITAAKTSFVRWHCWYRYPLVTRKLNLRCIEEEQNPGDATKGLVELRDDACPACRAAARLTPIDGDSYRGPDDRNSPRHSWHSFSEVFREPEYDYDDSENAEDDLTERIRMMFTDPD